MRARMHCPNLRVPNKLQLLLARWYPLLAPNKVYTRADLDYFWETTKHHWRQRQWFRIPPHLVAFNMFRDAQLQLMFLMHVVRAH
jgi:hypothetical protein